jgi:hypothetical protein
MDRSIVAWSIIGAFLVLCVWFDWPDDPSGRAYQVAGLAFIATLIGMVVAAFYVVHIRGRSLRDITWGATKMTLGVIAAIAGLFGFVFVFLWLDEHLPWWIAIPLVSIGYGVLLSQGIRLIDYFRGVKRPEN